MLLLKLLSLYRQIIGDHKGYDDKRAQADHVAFLRGDMSHD